MVPGDENSSRRHPSSKEVLKEYSSILPGSTVESSLVTFKTKFQSSPKTE